MQSSECSYICDQFTEYHDETLAREIKAKVETHLSVCPPCQKTFNELTSMLQHLQKLPSISTTKNFTDELMQKINQVDSQSFLMRYTSSGYARIAGYAIAAGLVVAIGINMYFDPVAPKLQIATPQFTEEKTINLEGQSSLAGLSDSIAGSQSDSLEIPATIQSNGQKLLLVNDSK